jgi:peptidylprolyl isomerase
MKLKYPLIAAFVAMLSLTACGGGSGSGGSSVTTPVASPTQLTKTDTLLGTSNDASLGANLTVNYSGWLYSDSTADHKGNKFDSSSVSFVLGAGKVIPGFEQGVTGMKQGGKRTLLVPANLAFGATGGNGVPPNSGLVYEVELTKVEYPTSGPVTLTRTDTVTGTGADAVTGKKVTVTYTGWLYSATAAGNKGTQFDTGNFPFTLGSGQVIPGFDLGVTGMKVGGKRTVMIPYTLGYGTTAYGNIPASSGLVFEIQLTKVE